MPGPEMRPSRQTRNMVLEVHKTAWGQEKTHNRVINDQQSELYTHHDTSKILLYFETYLKDITSCMIVIRWNYTSKQIGVSCLCIMSQINKLIFDFSCGRGKHVQPNINVQYSAQVPSSYLKLRSTRHPLQKIVSRISDLISRQYLGQVNTSYRAALQTLELSQSQQRIRICLLSVETADS